MDENVETDEKGSWRRRTPRIALITAILFAAQWRLVGPGPTDETGALKMLPWALLALLAPLAIGAWAFDVTSSRKAEFKTDLLWAVVFATALLIACMVASG